MYADLSLFKAPQRKGIICVLEAQGVDPKIIAEVKEMSHYLGNLKKIIESQSSIIAKLSEENHMLLNQ